MTGETHRATQDEARAPTDVPRRARPWRFFLKGGALALMLGVGWIAGAKMHELAHLAQVSSTTWAHVVQTRTSLETALAGVASWAASRDRSADTTVNSTPAS